ncbi:MAG: nitrogen fixation NifU-like protein [Verrucomicrobiales bacterium]|jgi:nitrogen fixation NifU-like protein
MNSELEDLYQEIILDHNRRPRNDGELDPCTHRAEGFNPLCGDKLTVYLRKPGEQIDEIACDCQGCAISRASASIMTTMIKGKAPSEIEKVVKGALDLLTADEEPEIDLAVQGDLAALIGVRKFPARIKCATLAWHALQEALHGGEQASSE